VSFDVPIFDDNTYEGMESFAIQIVKIPKKVGIVDPAKTTVTILDNEGNRC